MFIRDVFRSRRDVAAKVPDIPFLQEINGKMQPCQEPQFANPFDPLPTCTHAGAVATASSSASAFSSATAPPPPAPPPAASTTSSLIVASTSIPPPPETTSAPIVSISSTSTIISTTAIVVSETSVESIVSTVLSSPISSTVISISSSSPSVAPLPIPLSTVGSSGSAVSTTTLAEASSSFIQTSPLAGSATLTSSFASSTGIASLNPTLVSSSSSLPSSTSTSSAESTSENEIVAPPSSGHLSTDSKVAIAAAVILAVLGLFVGALYVYTRRNRASRARRNAEFSMMSNDYVIDEGDDGDKRRLVMTGAGTGMVSRELGPNGYPVDIKMEDGTLLTEAGSGSRPGSRTAPIIVDKRVDVTREICTGKDRPTVGLMRSPTPEKAGESSTARSMTKSTNGKSKLDLVALPMPATVAVARAINEAGSYHESRENRINALSNARILPEGANSPTTSGRNSRQGGTTSPETVPTSNVRGSGTKSPIPKGVRFGEKIRNFKHGNSASRNISSPIFDHRAENVQLSLEGQELASLTKEYEAERAQREKNSVGEVKKCMEKDKNVEVHSPTLPALDFKKASSGIW